MKKSKLTVEIAEHLQKKADKKALKKWNKLVNDVLSDNPPPIKKTSSKPKVKN